MRERSSCGISRSQRVNICAELNTAKGFPAVRKTCRVLDPRATRTLIKTALYYTLRVLIYGVSCWIWSLTKCCAAVCLTILVYVGPIRKLGSCCRAKKQTVQRSNDFVVHTRWLLHVGTQQAWSLKYTIWENSYLLTRSAEDLEFV